MDPLASISAWAHANPVLFSLVWPAFSGAVSLGYKQLGNVPRLQGALQAISLDVPGLLSALFNKIEDAPAPPPPPGTT